jgi:TolB-like protein/Flp pilus assembly protein TadD
VVERQVSRWSGQRIALAAVIVAALAAAGAFVYHTRSGNPPPEADGSNGRVMLAILPFENLGGDPEQAYLTDGLTEEMITELGRLNPVQLGVIARMSAMSYKGTTKTAAEIARELGVDFILEGSVRRESDRVRIVAQLIRARDQTHIWAERYDRDLGSILSLQSEVARAIAAQTRMRLSGESAARLERPLNVHAEAYQAYLKGRFFLNQRTGDAIQKALEHFQQAVAAEPAYAQAYAGVADAHELLASYANVVPRESFERAIEAARHALELDPELSEPYTSLGTIHTSYTWDWAQAEHSFVRALELNPSSVPAHKGYSELLSFLGRHDEALGEAKRAVELDPLSLVSHANLGIIYYRASRYDDALRQMTQTLNMDPNYLLGYLNLGLIHAARGAYNEAVTAFQRATSYSPEFTDSLGLLGYAYAKAGRIADARAIGTELRRLSEERYISGYILAHYHLGLGEREQALTELERAYEERSWLVALLKVDPLLHELRSDPRFRALLLRLKFPG